MKKRTKIVISLIFGLIAGAIAVCLYLAMPIAEAIIEDGKRMENFKFPRYPKEGDTITFLKLDSNRVDCNTIVTNSGDTFHLGSHRYLRLHKPL